VKDSYRATLILPAPNLTIVVAGKQNKRQMHPRDGPLRSLKWPIPKVEWRCASVWAAMLRSRNENGSATARAAKGVNMGARREWICPINRWSIDRHGPQAQP
jgi:hypothetical protein